MTRIRDVKESVNLYSQLEIPPSLRDQTVSGVVRDNGIEFGFSVNGKL